MDKKKSLELSDMQKYVTKENGTEPPFKNEYWDFFEDGIYVDLYTGDPLFSSTHKFESSCGWPAFYQSLVRSNILLLEDKSLITPRVEVRSKNSDAHLGHVFTDGPAPTGIRYCINSAAIQFIAKNELKDNGYQDYLDLFDKKKSVACETKSFLTLGAGCFWGVEAILSKTAGVVKATSGYCGGENVNPTYEQICTGKTGHAEVVQVEFDEKVISLEEILDLFFRLHDPTTLNAQGYDVGTQYRSVIFYHEESQLKSIEKCKEKAGTYYPNPIVTEIQKFETFYPAEEYHQDYYNKKYQGGMGPICHFVRGV